MTDWPELHKLIHLLTEGRFQFQVNLAIDESSSYLANKWDLWMCSELKLRVDVLLKRETNNEIFQKRTEIQNQYHRLVKETFLELKLECPFEFLVNVAAISDSDLTESVTNYNLVGCLLSKIGTFFRASTNSQSQDSQATDDHPETINGLNN